jgi:hypothetical protein
MAQLRAADDRSDPGTNGRAMAGAAEAERDKALGVSESPRYPRSRKLETDQAGRPAIGLFRIRRKSRTRRRPAGSLFNGRSRLGRGCKRQWPRNDETRHVPCQNAGSVSPAAEGIEGREQIPNGGHATANDVSSRRRRCGAGGGGAAGRRYIWRKSLYGRFATAFVEHPRFRRSRRLSCQ